MAPLLQLVGVAVTPLKVTVLRFCVAPKLDPLMVTGVPMGPVLGERFAMFGCGAGSVTLRRESKDVSIVSSPFALTVGAVRKKHSDPHKIPVRRGKCYG